MITFRIEDLKTMNARMREFAEFLISCDVDDEAVFFSRLVSCELISNVIRHGGDTAEFRGELLPDRISITVSAESQDSVNLRTDRPEAFAESGRGLYIINAVSINGVERGERGELKVYIKRN